MNLRQPSSGEPQGLRSDRTGSTDSVQRVEDSERNPNPAISGVCPAWHITWKACQRDDARHAVVGGAHGAQGQAVVLSSMSGVANLASRLSRAAESQSGFNSPKIRRLKIGINR
ncbi:hypothetical protein CC1G_15470 [Coprinopsis cinerea okayama7|uniref:Uncharacterized protein n=1 Tax=Coprinopsis cinerea (strain Okayama-7 / 130 / ATCC MYA-4618 / FGSC 9003) TaxID=240176 RepID=D6RQV4_COPC7|nr:hypothetical protein CC1G_15470 [Coprinopsis cinerea okayama7\|eukprot:XP_002910193.1 hypothetical protein CC1G_15470 [Coprinopsis cinerea okayama7\